MFARFISMLVESEQDPVTRAKGVRKEEQEPPNSQPSENGWSGMNYNNTSGEWNRRVYLYLQEQSELDRKCHKQNLSGWIKRKSVWEQMWDIQLRPMLLSGSEGFNYWWHWLICMKHLLSNVTYAQELLSGDDFFSPLVHKLSVTLKYKCIAHLKYVCCINVKKRKTKHFIEG